MYSDQWLVLIVGLAILASASRGLRLPPSPLSRRARWIMAGLLAAVLAGSVPLLSQATLLVQVAESYPVAAVEHVHRHAYPGPLFNPFHWGGYLIYALP